MIIINKKQVREALSMSQAIILMEKAMREASEGKTLLPLRWGLEMPDGGVMGMMPGYMNDPECFGIKLVNIMPENIGTEYSSHLGCMLLFEARHGLPLAIIDAGEITAYRTAAASALATKYLARDEAKVLTIIGAGEQGRSHLQALRHVRDFTEYRVWSHDLKEAEEYQAEMSSLYDVNVNVCKDIGSAVAGSDVICTVTSAPSPILFGEMLEPGMHLNVVGSSIRQKQEIDTAAVKRVNYFVDYRMSAMNQAGEFLKAVEEGAIHMDHLKGEIGSVISGRIPGRCSSEDITLYRSLGVATQDLVVAKYLYDQAKSGGSGTTVDFL